MAVIKLRGADPETMQYTQLALVRSEPINSVTAKALKKELELHGAQNCYLRENVDGTEVIAMFKRDRLSQFWDDYEQAYFVEVNP